LSPWPGCLAYSTPRREGSALRPAPEWGGGMVEIEATATEYLLRIHAKERHRAKQFGGTWDAKRKRWVFPKTVEMWEALQEEFRQDLVQKIPPPQKNGAPRQPEAPKEPSPPAKPPVAKPPVAEWVIPVAKPAPPGAVPSWVSSPPPPSSPPPNHLADSPPGPRRAASVRRPVEAVPSRRRSSHPRAFRFILAAMGLATALLGLLAAFGPSGSHSPPVVVQPLVVPAVPVVAPPPAEAKTPPPGPAVPEAKAGPPVCPKCGGPMRLRNGRFGPFYGCLKYPACRGTVDAPPGTAAPAGSKPRSSRSDDEEYRRTRDTGPISSGAGEGSNATGGCGSSPTAARSAARSVARIVAAVVAAVVAKPAF
jgi:hypothetical protein